MSLRVVLATRNAGKVREIREIAADYEGIGIVGLDDVGIPESPEEVAIEAFETFEENALAKARYFAGRSGQVALADDSGICIDALGGAPGVHSRRFAKRGDLRGPEQDRANNELVVQLLQGREGADRAAQYVCVAALAWPDGREEAVRGTCQGVLLHEPRGSGGFGYDPLFYLPDEGATFGELAPRRKNVVSHRAKAVRRALDILANKG